jgi:hypothetical protein
MITTQSSRQIDRPCGCGARVSSISGSVENGSTPVFRALLMSQCATPHLWVMLVTGPWEGRTKDCAVVIRSLRDENGIHSSLESVESSPWRNDALDLHPLSRDEVLAVPGAREWVFETWDILTTGQHEIAEFLYTGA